MGVQGLWDVVHPAGQTRSIVHLATEAFRENRSGKRGYRIGIDASIWYHHASFSKGGENPELRFLFFKLAHLTRQPLVPLFVFDGRERPKVKRGSRVGKSGSHALTAGLKKLLDLFGMEWRMALGEAEAELAWLSRQGVIDAVLSDDVDALVFGAVTTMKNSSLQLSSNKSKPTLDANGKKSVHHAWVFTADAIQRHPAVGLSRSGLILIALLSGGDYSQGVSKYGPAVAHGLARCGFGDDLMHIYERRTVQDVQPLLAQWRESVDQELRTNARGFLSRKSATLAIPYNFPDFKVMENYVYPVTTERQGRAGGGALRDVSHDMSIPRLAAFCEVHFGEWGYEDAIIERFRTVLWESVVMRLLRRAALEADERQNNRRLAGSNYAVRDEVGTPLSFIRRHFESFEMTNDERIAAAFANRGPQPTTRAADSNEDKNPLRMQIVGSRRHVSTDNTLEYRVEFIPSIFVAMARKACKRREPARPSTRTQEIEDEWGVMINGSVPKKKKDPKTPPPPPDSAMRMWIPACIMETVHPSLVEAFLAVETVKKAGEGKGKGKARARPAEVTDDDDDDFATDSMDIPGVDMDVSQSKYLARPSPPASTLNADLSRRAPFYAFPDRYLPASDSRTSRAAAPAHTAVLSSSDTLGQRSGFLFWFPNPDDPDMLVLEDGLELPSFARPSPWPAASADIPRKGSVPPAASQPCTIWDNVYDQVMPTGLGSSQTRTAVSPKKTKAPASSQTPAQPQRARQRTPEPAPDFAALFAEPQDEHPAPRNAYDDVFDQVFVPRSQRHKKTTATPRTKPSRQARVQPQRRVPVPSQKRIPGAAPDHAAVYAEPADEVPALPAGRRNAFDDVFDQVFVPRSQRPTKATAPAPGANPPSQARTQPRRADPPRRQTLEPAPDYTTFFPEPEDLPIESRNAFDDVFDQVFLPRSQRSTLNSSPNKRGRVSASVASGNSTRTEGACSKPAKRPRTTAPAIAGPSTVTRPILPSQPVSDRACQTSKFDTNVIEIDSSDGEGVAPKPTQPAHGRRLLAPASSRDSRLSLDMDVIDLT